MARNVMEKFRLNEISAVDRPAQAHAKAVIMKRAPRKGEPGYVASKVDAGDEGDLDMSEEDGENETKSGGKGKRRKTKKSDRMIGVLTSAEDGHTHLVHLERGSFAGTTTWQTSDAEDGGGHDHPWAHDAEGNIVIGMADGHSHTVSMEDVNAALLSMLKSDEDTTISPDPKAGTDSAAQAAPQEEATMSQTKKGEDLDAVQAELDDVTKSNDRNAAIVALSPEHRAHFDTLKGEDADAYLGKSADERSDVLKAATDADPVVYKAADGSVFRSSDDERLISAVKRADLALAKADTERAAREGLELEKRADVELPNLPGTPAVRGALLKSIDGIEDEETRNGVLESLKSANEGIFERANGSPEAQRQGNDYVPADHSAEAQLDALATKRATEKGISIAKAYNEVIAEPEGATLYNQYTVERPALGGN